MRPRVASCNASRRTDRARRAIAAALFLLAAPAPAAADDAAPEMLATDLPAWEDVESLWNRGGLPGLPVFTRPLPRIDVAAALAATLAERPELARTGAARRLSRELAPELARLGVADAPRETPALLDVAEGGARLRARSDTRLRATTTGGRGEIIPGTRAGVLLRVELPGGGFALADVAVAKIVDASPIGDAVVKGSDWYLSSEEAYLSWRTRPADVFVGLARNRWGPGDSGTLLLSDAALSYPSIQLARTFGRRARFATLVASLHAPATDPDDPRVAGPRLGFAAHRLDFALGPRVRVGLHEAAAYRSNGTELPYAIGVVPYTLVQRWFDRATADGASTAPQRNNVLAGLDLTWRIGGGVRVDAELMLDDVATESASQPDRWGWQTGASWAGHLGRAAADARVEMTKVTRYAYAVFYDADFVHDGVPLGYGTGPDVEHARGWLERDFGPDVRLGAGLEWTRKGEGVPGDPWDPASGGSRGSSRTLSGVVERSVFPHVRARGSWRDVAEIRVHAGVLDVRDRAHVRGDDDASLQVRAEARIEW